MLQVQLEIDSTVFFNQFKTNRIDIIAESVEQAIQIAATVDPEISIIMPEYMVPVSQCTDYDYSNTPISKRFFVLGKYFKGMQGQIFNGAKKLESGTMPWLCDTDLTTLAPLNGELTENLDDLAIYMD